jgi:hypothetical protein
MATNDFLPFAVGGSANVVAQSAYAALAAITNGYQTGFNSVDDGTTATLLANLKKSMPGRYLGSQVFSSSGTYTPGTYNGVTATKARFRGVAGGGGSGGTIATGSTAGAVSAGGNAGNQFDFVLSPTASQAITVGAAGAAGAAGANGGNGGDTVIGSIATIKGGKGSGTGNATTTFPTVSNPTFINTASTISGTGVTVLLNILGEAGRRGVALALGTTSYGDGGSGPYGARGTIDQVATGYGVGACGQAVSASTAATAGLAGTPGIVIVDEYA